MRALISVTDKTGLIPFAVTLSNAGVEIVSTGGTCKAIKDAGILCMSVVEVTGFPEILDGRVKTLHPLIHGGILGDIRKEKHRVQMAEHRIHPIDIVVVNLYDFAANPSIEEIDIGGPSLLRAAAKNYKSMVVAVCDPEDYVEVGLVIKAGGTFSENFRFRLAAKAFEATARYDRMIADYMNDLVATGKTLDAGVHHH